MKFEKCVPGINKHKLKDVENQKKYRDAVNEKMKNATEKGPKEAWKETAKFCLESAEEVLGRIDKKKKVEDPEIADLSDKQKKIKECIETCRIKNKEKTSKCKEMKFYPRSIKKYRRK